MFNCVCDVLELKNSERVCACACVCVHKCNLFTYMQSII